MMNVLQSEDENFMCDTFEELKENCPLKQMPEKANHPEFWDNGRYDKGWNDCIDEIMKGNNMTYRIWKLPLNHPSKFRGFGECEVELRDYVTVYKGEIEVGENEDIYSVLEKLFEIFNNNHPNDYHFSSLSVSDVVGIARENEKITEWYYVDSIGFKKLDWRE